MSHAIRWTKCDACGANYNTLEGHPSCINLVEDEPSSEASKQAAASIAKTAHRAFAFIIYLMAVTIGSGLIWLTVQIWKAIIG